MKPLRAILLLAVSSGKQAAASKQSLPEQDERLHELASQNNWDIVDIITVPGHSRVYYTYREFADDALREGIPAPMRMFDHWKKCDFDVFACSSGDRFGREQSIFAEVVGRTIDAGAVVFTLRDGEINPGNRRMFVSMGGYQAAVEIDELVRRHKFGSVKRAKRGLPNTSHGLIPSHVTVGKGDTERAIVNEDTRRLFIDIAELLLAGVSFRQMPNLLAERGHIQPNGRPYHYSTLHDWMMHPTLYGNTAQNFHNAKNGRSRGFWVFDSTEEPPENVTVHYDTHPPMYEGVLGERVKAEMRRRFGLGGRGAPSPKRKFAGLVVCDWCHYAVSYRLNGKYFGVACRSRHNQTLATDCPNVYYVNEKKLIAFADDLLRNLAQTDDWSALYSDSEPDNTVDRLASVDRELKNASLQAKELMSERASIPPIFLDEFRESLKVLGDRVEALKAEQARLTRQAQDAAPTPVQLRALEDFKNLPPKAFWQLPNVEINQWLRLLLGSRRFVISNGEVIGTTSQPRLSVTRMSAK